MIARWFAGLMRGSEVDDGLHDGACADATSEPRPEPAAVAGRFLADPDHFVVASVDALDSGQGSDHGSDHDSDHGIGIASATACGLRIEIVVDGQTLASARIGAPYVADDGETTAELSHYAVGAPFQGRGVGACAARSMFRHLNARHRVTRVLFVAPVVRSRRASFEAFVKRIGAQPFGRFADDPQAPPLFAWSLRESLG